MLHAHQQPQCLDQILHAQSFEPCRLAIHQQGRGSVSALVLMFTIRVTALVSLVLSVSVSAHGLMVVVVGT